MSTPVTSYLNSTESLVDFAVEKLEASTHWTVGKLPGMVPERMLERNPVFPLPSVWVTHTASGYGEFPCRTAEIAVLVHVDAFDRDAEFSARDLADEVISLLDDQVVNKAHYRIERYRALTLDPGIVTHLLEFRVTDH